MKNTLLLLTGAAALSLASCSSDNKTATTTTDGSGTTTTTTTTTSMDTPEMMEARAQRIADKMVADMKITDEATKTKIRTVYVNRARRMGEMRTRFATDTVGMSAAMRSAGDETDTEFKGIFTDPTQYSAYESSRATYDESNYMDDASMSGSGSMSSDGSMSSGSDMSGADKSSMSSGSTSGSMSGDDTKVKVKADGDIKIKDTQGNKTKIDGDDGTMKTKDADGTKTKM